jgi:dolichol-phosphate mannosyltransferase
MQHDERVLPAMLTKLRDENCDLVVGTRYAGAGGVGEWNAARATMSRVATKIGAVLLGKNHTSDPMSGFFMLRRELLNEVVADLSGEGFKILLDLLATAKRPLKIGEVAYNFRLREHGESKLSLGVLTDFALLLADKMVGKYVPARFLLFVMVGLLGVAVHFGVLAGLLRVADFNGAQIAATFAAMIANFFCNNYFTYGDRTLRGAKLWRGLALFVLICAVGALPNIAIADYLYVNLHAWWAVAGGVGMLVSAVWNFSASHHFIWR